MAGTLEWPELVTSRLRLRDWRDDDLEAFAAMNADPRVTEFLPARLDRAQSDALAARIRAHIRERGFGWWAVEVPGEVPFIGFVGLSVPQFQAQFTPCVEISWRLAADHWGRGHATEAARLALNYGFDRLGLLEIVSFTTRANRRSKAVMERLGMRHDLADDFEHPALPPGHPLRPHVLYRATARHGSGTAVEEPGRGPVRTFPR